MGEEVSLKDVYDAVGETRKELSDQIEKVNGDVVDVKVAVGKIETKLDTHEIRIKVVEDEQKTLRDKVHEQRVKAAQMGGLAGVGITALLRALEWLLSQINA
jgi:peptidoglycan hydrolase CwlO-like protein